MDNKQLIKLLRQGDSEAIMWVYREASHYCESFVLKNNGIKEDAEDIFQETMMILYRKIQIDSFKLIGHIKYFLYGIIKRVWYEELRRRGKNPSFLPLEKIDKGEIPLETAVNQSLTPYDIVFKKALNKLDEKCKNILLDKYSGIRLKDIAEEKETTVNYTKQLVYRCMKKLKKLISDELS